MTKQLNEVAPLVAALMGALVGMGLERNKAQRAAQQAVDNAENPQQAAPPPQGDDYNQTMRRGSRGEGVRELQQKLGMRQVDGIFGPATERAVRTFQQSQGIKVDGIVGPETRARIMRLQSDTAESAVNEDVTISGDAEDLLRMMQLAGAKDAKAVDVDDINPGPKPCPMCGKVHGEYSCGNRNGDLAKSIAMMADEDWDNSPEEEYSTAKDIATASGNDLHKSKGSHYKAAGGDNPMALEDELREKLAASYAEKKR